MTIIRILTAMVCLVSLALFAGEAQPQDDELDTVVQFNKNAPPVPPTKVVKDDYVQVVGQYKSANVKKEGYLVQEVIYADKDTNYQLGLEKRDEGRYPLAALYFSNALDAMKDRKWAAEYCNYNIGNAFFAAKFLNGYKGRSRTYAPASEYFKKALDANPKSRYMLDIVVKLPTCYAEQGKLTEADAAIKDAEARIKTYTDETGKLGPGYAVPVSRAVAQLAIAKAHISEKKVAERVAGETAQTTHDLWHEARVKAANHPDLLAECVEGELRGLIQMKQYDQAITEANVIIEKFNKGNEYSLMTQLPAAYMSLGQANLGKAVDYETRGNLQWKQTYAEARWAFLNVIAQFFDNDDYVAQAHYLAGFCYEKLKDIEPDDAKTKAIREWQAVVTNFPKSPFKDNAVKNLEKYGVKVEEAPVAPPVAPKTEAPKAEAPKQEPVKPEPAKPDPKAPKGK